MPPTQRIGTAITLTPDEIREDKAEEKSTGKTANSYVQRNRENTAILETKDCLRKKRVVIATCNSATAYVGNASRVGWIDQKERQQKTEL
jgi:hypothetical protein